MRLLPILIMALFFPFQTIAQDLTQDHEAHLIYPHISLSVGVAPHYSSFHFNRLQSSNFGIQTSYGSMQYTPLANLTLTAGVTNMSLSYQLVTTFPFKPTYDIYTERGNLFNRNVYQEWTQAVTFRARIYKSLVLGLGYHHRTIRFDTNTLSPKTNFSFSLQKQQNLLLIAETSFVVDDFWIEPSLNYSIRHWQGLAYNYYSRSSDEISQDYAVTIINPTRYWGAGVKVGHTTFLNDMTLSFRFESFDNGRFQNERYLLSLSYKLDVLSLLQK